MLRETIFAIRLLRRNNMPSGVYKHKPCSEETKRKISERLKGRIFGHKFQEGQKPTEETRKKMSKAQKGRKISEEHKRKISKAFKGSKNPSWKGGKSFEPYTIDWTQTLKRSIRERDHYICQLCSQYENTVHHIDYNKKNCNPNNLITLCRGCNGRVNFNRKHWTNYFKKII